MSSLINEIGSEFSCNEINQEFSLKLPKGFNDTLLTFCGRTSISIIIQKIPNIRKAMLPSYCCDSMIEPFRRMNIEVFFYNVNYDNGLNIDLELPGDIDVLLWCNYFGYKTIMPELSDFITNGGIIIEDITHSLFSAQQYNTQSQFLIASLRKWGPIVSGGFCASKDYNFNDLVLNLPDESFINMKTKAMFLKEQYLHDGDEKKKEEYLALFYECNQWLSNNYLNLRIDIESQKKINGKKFEQIVSIRRRNAKILHDGLKNHPDISFLFELTQMDCPIFVPIIVKNNKRDIFHKKLIENKIYCPIHWPKPNTICNSNLYDNELSLICDQRYSDLDMYRIIDVLINIK